MCTSLRIITSLFTVVLFLYVLLFLPLTIQIYRRSNSSVMRFYFGTWLLGIPVMYCCTLLLRTHTFLVHSVITSWTALLILFAILAYRSSKDRVVFVSAIMAFLVAMNFLYAFFNKLAGC